MRFADDVLWLSTSLNQLNKMMSNFERCTEEVWLKVHPEKTKILFNKRSNRQKEAQIDDISVEILPSNKKTKYMGQTITLATRNDGNREQDQSRLGSLCHAQTRVNTQILPPIPQTTIIQRRHHAIDVVRCRHMRVNAGTCEDDPIHTTQDVPTHHPNDKKIQEQEQKRKRREGYDGRRKKPRYAADSDEDASTNIGRDQDSDVSCVRVPDDDMDTAEVDEEDWIDFII